MSAEVMRMPIEAHDVKRSKHVMLKGRPCTIVDVKTSKTGKHGHMKCNMTGIDVLTNKKYTALMPGHATLNEFKLEKNECMLVDIHADGTEIVCLSANNQPITVRVDPENEMMKRMKADFAAEKQLLITLITAPVEKNADTYTDVQQVESYKEDSTEGA
jgi:translation initiation factor 5A